MNYEIIINEIGLEKYKAYKAAVWKNINSGKDEYVDSDIPLDVFYLIFESDISNDEKLNLIWQFYHETPSSSFLGYIEGEYDSFSEKNKSQLYNKIAHYLSGQDEFYSKPVEYFLWCGLFESPTKVYESWPALSSRRESDLLIQRILINSGPVPFELKGPLYKELLADKKWHYFIFKGVLHSAFDYYGDISEAEVNSIFPYLEIPVDTKHYDTLRIKLTYLDEYRRRFSAGDFFKDSKEFMKWEEEQKNLPLKNSI